MWGKVITAIINNYQLNLRNNFLTLFHRKCQITIFDDCFKKFTIARSLFIVFDKLFAIINAGVRRELLAVIAFLFMKAGVRTAA